MRPQAAAVHAVEDGAACRGGIAIVGRDQYKRVAEQFDMFVIDRGHAGDERADQAYRTVAAADAGLEHREIALPLGKVQAGQREHGFEGAEPRIAPLCNFGDRGSDPRHETRQIIIADWHAIDLKPFVETIEMRRGEQSGSQAASVRDTGAERLGRTFAVGPGHDDRNAREPGALDPDGVEQARQPRETNAITIY